jgi:hypothetical protein
MKRQLLITAAAAALLFGASAAWADCAEELAQLQEGVSKTGAMAPLAESAPATPQTGGGAAAGGESATGDGEIAKTGDTAPLEANPDVATSAQDAQAQSAGGETAAAQAEGAEGDGASRAEALARAQAALDAGDEAGCMAAVEEAKAM